MKTIEDAVRELGGVWPFEWSDRIMYWDKYHEKYHEKYAARSQSDDSNTIYFNYQVCTRYEFEEYTKKLRNEPGWDDAPDWAVAKAQDSDGMWCWYEDVPRPGESTFMWSRGAVRFAVKGEVIGDWRDTLRLRPEENKVEDKNDWLKNVRDAFTKNAEEFDSLLMSVLNRIEGHERSEKSEKTTASDHVELRPLQTERERWIEMAERIADEISPYEPWGKVVARIYDAGLAKMPEVK